MIRLLNIDKRYRKKRRNELHVLKDIDLTLPEQGLIALVGASGSGKTTLLNIMSGMDAADSGTVKIGDVVLDKYRTRVFDLLRSEHIGMVFQNYYLLEDRTVQDNIALTLRMIGIEDQTIIENRTAHVLEAVRMHKYAPRVASQLSGGQQQRVAIARALAKDPAVLLADEPTGNLDSKNTFDIMNILRHIAQTKLVVLVTHERDLANHFADRIIEIEDGRIIDDVEPETSSAYRHTRDTDIYLRDLPVKETLGERITYYGDVALEEDADIRLVHKNGTLYIGIRKQPLKKVVVLDKQSEVHLLDASEADRAESEEIVPAVTLKPLEKPKKKRFKNPVYDVATIVRQTLSSLLTAPFGRRIVYLAFFFGAMVVANAVSTLFNVITVDDAEFMTMPKNTLVIEDRDVEDYATLSALSDDAAISAVRLHHEASFPLQLPPLYAPFRDFTGLARFDVSFVPVSTIDPGKIVHGDMPQGPFEIVLDESFVERRLLRHYLLKVLELTDIEDVLGMDVVLDLGDAISVPVTIVGIVDTGTPVVYAEEPLIAAFFENTIRLSHAIDAYQERFIPYELFEDTLVIRAGRRIEAPGEVLIPTGYKHDDLFVNIGDTLEFSGRTYDVVGFYSVEEDLDTRAVMGLEDLEELFYLRTRSDTTERYLYADDVSAALAALRAQGIEGRHVYAEQRAWLLERALFIHSGTFTFSLIALAGMVVGLYFIIRSAMISRIYEYGVLRALGVRRHTMIARALLESFVIATATSIAGFAVMTFFIARTQSAVGGLLRLGHVSFLSVVTGIALLYAVNLFAGAAPLAMLLRKKPSEIITKYDI